MISETRTDFLTVLDAGPVGSAEQWVREHRQELRRTAAAHGAVLVRGLPIGGRSVAVAAVAAFAGEESLAEREGFAPRDAYAPGVYSSSHWSDDQPMCMHHELSYLRNPPRFLAFACVTPPSDGGITALADAAAVLRDLPADLVERFGRHGWQLTRHYNPLVGTSWQDAFGSEDRAEVARYCEENNLTATWQADGSLTTRQTQPAVRRHPESGADCWFNQVAFLNEWTLEPEVRDFLVEEFGSQSLPFNTVCGDGTGLDRATVDEINAVYERHTVRRPWQRGDLLVVDNLRTAHSREPFRGTREIVVGMSDPFSD